MDLKQTTKRYPSTTTYVAVMVTIIFFLQVMMIVRSL